MFAAAWIQTLFAYVDALPFEVLERAWTVLLLERSWKIMHRLALGILCALEPHILASCAHPHDTLLYLSQLTRDGHADKRRRGSQDPDAAQPLEITAEVEPHVLFGARGGATRLLERAMDIKVTNSMLARVPEHSTLIQ